MANAVRRGKAQFWMPRIVMNGTDVEKWFDVRETNMAKPTRCYLNGACAFRWIV